MVGVRGHFCDSCCSSYSPLFSKALHEALLMASMPLCAWQMDCRVVPICARGRVYVTPLNVCVCASSRGKSLWRLNWSECVMMRKLPFQLSPEYPGNTTSSTVKFMLKIKSMYFKICFKSVQTIKVWFLSIRIKSQHFCLIKAKVLCRTKLARIVVTCCIKLQKNDILICCFFSFVLFRLQDEIGIRQDAENNLNAFRQVILFPEINN